MSDDDRGVSSSYSQRHLDPGEALAYRDKFERSWTRRLSHSRERRIVLELFDAALELVPPNSAPESPRVLDFPCGAGRFAPHFARRVASYVGADHSPAMLALCRSALEHDALDQRARFVEGDAREMPFDDASFDLAACIRLIHHFQDPSEQAVILAEFARVTKGPIVLTYLDAESPKQRLHAYRCSWSGRQSRRAPLTRRGLGEMSARCGLHLVKTKSLSGLFSGQCVALLARQ